MEHFGEDALPLRHRSDLLSDLLDAHEEYRRALLRFYDRLDILNAYAGDPRVLFASLVVAEIVSGIALPPPEDYLMCSAGTVFGPDGELLRVVCVSDRDNICGGLIESGGGLEKYDMLAVVAFVHAAPVAVHLIAADRLCAVAQAFGVPRLASNHLAITMLTHSNFLLEPVAAAALGVTTYDLLPAGDRSGAHAVGPSSRPCT